MKYFFLYCIVFKFFLCSNIVAIPQNHQVIKKYTPKKLKKSEPKVVVQVVDNRLIEQIENGPSLVKLPDNIDTSSYSFDMEELKNSLLAALHAADLAKKN